MRIIYLVIFTLIYTCCSSQNVIGDTTFFYNGYYQVNVDVPQKKSTIKRSLFNKDGKLIRFQYGHYKRYRMSRNNVCTPIGVGFYKLGKTYKFNEKGNKTRTFSDTIFNNQTGKINSFGNYKNGKKVGKWTTLHPNGSIKDITYRSSDYHNNKSFYDNGVRTYVSQIINLKDTSILWQVCKNDTLVLEPIKNSYPHSKLEVYRNYDRNGNIESIWYYLVKSKNNAFKKIEFFPNGKASSYSEREFKRYYSYKNSFVIRWNKDGSLSYFCKRDKRMNCIEQRGE